MTAEKILQVSGLRVELDGNLILQNVSFELTKGDTLVVLGPNGAGKTVLLRTLLGLLPHEGQVSWKSGTTLGYVPQRVPIDKDLPVTVEDFFHLRGASREASLEVLAHVGIRDAAFLEKRIPILSSGQLQRVLIAFALLGKPDVLLFDEPTTGIDVGGEETIHTLIEHARQDRNLTVILVTHDLNMVYRQASNVLCLSKTPMQFGPPDEILTTENLKKLYSHELKFHHHSHE